MPGGTGAAVATIFCVVGGDGLRWRVIGTYIMRIMPHVKITGYDAMLQSLALGWTAA